MKNLKKFFILFALLVVSCSLAGTQRLNAQDALLRQKLISEAPKAWQFYLARAARLQGSILFRSFIVQPDDGLNLESQLEFKQRDGCAIWMEQDKILQGKGATGGRLTALNSQYLFELTRRSETAPWTINRSLNVVDKKTFEIAEDPRIGATIFSSLPCRVTNAPETQLPTLFSQAQFSVKRVSSVIQDGRSLAKVEFVFDLPGLTKERRTWVKQGWLLFDPDLSWVLRGYEVQELRWAGDGKTPKSATLAAVHEYEKARDGFPMLTSYVQKRTSDDSVVRLEYKYDLVEANVPAAEFTLPAFGFPHPSYYRRWHISWYFWFALAGFAALGLGVYFRRRARRTLKPEAAR